MPRRIVLLTLVCLLVFAHRAAPASTHAAVARGGKELKKAEAVLSKLRRLEESAASGAPGAFAEAAGKLYPGLYASVSGLRDGDLKTELSTAVALYESALRAGDEGGGAAPDCSREMREAYARLCREAAGEGRAGLLRAKALLHARRAGAAISYARGDRDAATLEAVSTIRAERGTDRALAEEALHVLGELGAVVNGDSPSERSAYVVVDSGRLYEHVAGRLEQVDRILASLPRDRARQLLGSGRDAFRDALYWRLKALPARALVIDANSLADVDALPRRGLSADDADRAALANLRAGLRFIRKAKEELGARNAER